MEGKPPFFSICFIVFTDAHLVSSTLSSILKQKFDDREIIIVGSCEAGASLPSLLSTDPKITKVKLVDTRNLSELLNCAYRLSKGKYIQFMYAADQYISQYALTFLHQMIEKDDKADLVYCGFLERDEEMAPKAEFFSLTNELLQEGKLPTKLQCCCFKREVFQKLGSFDTRYEYRPGLDLLCKAFLDHTIQTAHSKRILLDYVFKKARAQQMIGFLWETFRIITRYFGLRKALEWWFKGEHLSVYQWFKKRVQKAFTQP